MPTTTEKQNLGRASTRFRLALFTELHLIGPPTTAIHRHSRHNLSGSCAHGFLSATAMHRHNRHNSSSTIAPGSLAAQWGPRCSVHTTLVSRVPMMAKKRNLLGEPAPGAGQSSSWSRLLLGRRPQLLTGIAGTIQVAVSLPGPYLLSGVPGAASTLYWSLKCPIQLRIGTLGHSAPCAD